MLLIIAYEAGQGDEPIGVKKYRGRVGDFFVCTKIATPPSKLSKREGETLRERVGGEKLTNEINVTFLLLSRLL